ncbi:unnamed protein product [Kluyveromyces dobzhanskii CBS 2104]|uniref:WGS project CCBQ000000000 data, contig 00006 n=1 Tax=Kluyveromyces dobzhanskii CBS 2104 TaxID=1427455 RepID=A0A0A8L8A1_9SACH|nr:unnamed protein product [Kluyveromyces dobzhanskii CBS 2104]
MAMQLRRSTRLRTVQPTKDGTPIGDAFSTMTVTSQVAERADANGGVLDNQNRRDDDVDMDSDTEANNLGPTDHDVSFDEMEPIHYRPTQLSTHLKISKPDYQSRGLEQIPVVDDEFVSKFNDLIGKQSTLFYNNLTSPEYVTYNNLEIFKYPSDKSNLETISRQLAELLPDINKNYDTDLKQLLEQIEEDEEREAKLRILNDSSDTETTQDPLQTLLNYQSEGKESDESKLIEHVARTHDINISDISEILIDSSVRTLKRPLATDNKSKKHDIGHISNKCSRLLTKERNHSLPWPIKKKKKQKDPSSIHEDVPLMSSN